jgi:hypothetical protein
VVVTVAVDDVLRATPLTVTNPVPDIATVPLAVAVHYVYFNHDHLNKNRVYSCSS